MTGFENHNEYDEAGKKTEAVQHGRFTHFILRDVQERQVKYEWTLCRAVPTATEEAWTYEPTGPVEHLSDVQGQMNYLCQWAEQAKCVGFKRRFQHAEECAMSATTPVFKFSDEGECKGAMFVYTGDVTGEGPAQKRAVEALLKFKREEPKRVFLLMGSRDIAALRAPGEVIDPKAQEANLALLKKLWLFVDPSQKTGSESVGIVFSETKRDHRSTVFLRL